MLERSVGLLEVIYLTLMVHLGMVLGTCAKEIQIYSLQLLFN